ncbi:MAG: YcxB family protein [Planctomycetota bacterium]
MNQPANSANTNIAELPTEVTFTLNEKTFRKLFWKYYGTYRLMQGRLIYGPLSCLFALLFAFGWIGFAPMPILGGLFFLNGLWLTFSRHYMINKAARTWKRMPDAELPTTMVITPTQELILTTKISTNRLSAAMLSHVRDFTLGIIVYLTKQHMILIPSSAFSSDQERQLWIQALQRLCASVDPATEVSHCP